MRGGSENKSHHEKERYRQRVRKSDPVFPLPTSLDPEDNSTASHSRSLPQKPKKRPETFAQFAKKYLQKHLLGIISAFLGITFTSIVAPLFIVFFQNQFSTVADITNLKNQAAQLQDSIDAIEKDYEHTGETTDIDDLRESFRDDLDSLRQRVARLEDILSRR